MMAPDGGPLAAAYFDGKTSRLQRVVVGFDGGCVTLDGDLQRRCPLEQVTVSERSRHAVRKLGFPDGAYLEAADPVALGVLLRRHGQRDPWVVALQQSWRGALFSALALVLVIVSGYLYALPRATAWLALAVPVSIERQLGAGTLSLLDREVFLPSQLSQRRQRALVAEFTALRPPRQGAPAYRVLFRRSRLGPNAFSLPSGDIVLTDELVALLPDDGEVMAVLAHELGHLHERHLMRRMLQSGAVGAAAMLLAGDVSSMMAGLPVLVLDMKYSRDFERAADDYAVAMLKRNGITPDALLRVFDALGKLDKGGIAYLSSHPPSAERIRQLRSAGP